MSKSPNLQDSQDLLTEENGDCAAGEDGCHPHSFTGLLESLETETSSDPVTFGQLLEVAGRRTFGPVILLLGAISISPLTIIPGANWAVATATLLFAGQLLIGRRRPWLPRNILDIAFRREHLSQMVKNGREAAHVADRLTAPRLTFLTEPPFVYGTALLCVLAALITYPLGLIPLGPVLPGVSIVLLGIGLTARDGLFLLMSGISLAGAAVLVSRFFV